MKVTHTNVTFMLTHRMSKIYFILKTQAARQSGSQADGLTSLTDCMKYIFDLFNWKILTNVCPSYLWCFFFFFSLYGRDRGVNAALSLRSIFYCSGMWYVYGVIVTVCCTKLINSYWWWNTLKPTYMCTMCTNECLRDSSYAA